VRGDDYLTGNRPAAGCDLTLRTTAFTFADKEKAVPDFETIAERYIKTWNETDPKARRAAIDAVWAEDARYVDPLANVCGRDEIDATIAAVQAQFPDFAFRLAGPVDGHHNQCRFQWELGPRDGDAPVLGFDVVELDEDGSLRTVLGFLDRVPTA
jgi:hypothetical protein